MWSDCKCVVDEGEGYLLDRKSIDLVLHSTFSCSFFFFPVSPYTVELHCLRPDKQEAFGWTSWADGGSTPASGGQCDDDNDDE